MDTNTNVSTARLRHALDEIYSVIAANASLEEIDHRMKSVNSLYKSLQPEMEPGLLHEMQNTIPEMNRLLEDMRQESQPIGFAADRPKTGIISTLSYEL